MIPPIKIAKKSAKYSKIKRARISAVAFSHSGELIATAQNRRVSGVKNKFTEHAEEVLIQKLDRLRAWDRFKNITILVLRIGARGITMAKPCSQCQELLKKYPVKVLYTDSDGIVQLFN